MVANPTVNMGGAVLLTSLAKARAAGVPEDRLVYPLGGASAEEPRDYLVRDQFYESHPQNAVLKAVMDLVEGDGRKFDAIELYSCFPCVPKMARRTLGPRPRRAADGDRRPHLLRRAAQHLHDACGHRDGAQACARAASSACSTARAVSSPSITGWCCRARRRSRRSSRTSASRPRPTANRRKVPDFVTEASGKGKVESFTVIYKGKGEVEHGVVMMRTEADARALARIPATDAATLAHLLNMDRTPVGSVGDDRDGRRRRAGVAGGDAQESWSGKATCPP